SRLAWCYGDPGIAAALLVAARAAGEPAWEDKALEVARGAARRPPEQSFVRDAGVCHGAAGLAHLFNRFWQASGEEIFRDAALHWIERTLEFRVPGEGIAGFSAWHAMSGPNGQWAAEPGLLEGATGIALVLLAAISTVEPEWDRILLVS
ncbi:MAG: lanthionine synthetase LanC family protein, partial [Acidobacteriota bacterium]